jgi:antitoxin (DNA-binding transcriptional repressor) of toxin-antitoxin stability system
MPTMTIEEAQARLPELIGHLAPGEEVILTRNARPVAKLIGQPPEQPRPVFGRGRGKVVVVSEDDDHLQGFKEYLP